MLGIEPIIGDEAECMSDTEVVLSFEVFVKIKNNFQCHFFKNWVGHCYRTQSAYQKCKMAHPNFCELAQYLMARCEYLSDVYIEELYEAYKMMRPYATSNWEMFQ